MHRPDLLTRARDRREPWDFVVIGGGATGLTAYDLLAGRWRFGRSKVVTANEVRRRLPTVQTAGLRGGVVYHDGQFDDARLNINLIQTAVDHGAVALNYAPAVGLTRGA